MDEVDYSQFLYNRPPSAPEPPVTHHRERRREKKGRGKTAVLIVVTVLLCFSILFFCVDFFSNGKLVKGIYGKIVKNEYTFYCVAIAYPTRETARAGVLLSEENGGAAYLIAEEKDFVVLSGVYCDKTSAEKVAEKNASFFTYTVKFATRDTALGNLIEKFVKETTVCIEKTETGEYNENLLSSHINNYSILFSSFEADSEEKKDYLSFLTSCLHSVEPGVTERAIVLFRLRHMLCSAIFSAKDLFDA